MAGAELIRFCGFTLDSQRGSLHAPDGEEVRLRPKSFDMLRFFIANAGRVVSKQDLLEAIWPNVHVGEDSLFQCIRDIRTALADDDRQLIKLVSGRGYLFDAEVSIAPAKANGAGSDPATLSQDLGSRPAADEADQATIPAVGSAEAATPKSFWSFTKDKLPGGWPHRWVLTGTAGLGVIIGLAAAAAVFRPIQPMAQSRPLIAVMPIIGVGDDPKTSRLAASLSERLSDGLSKIKNIRVVAPSSTAASGMSDMAAAREAEAGYVVTGRLQRSGDSWDVQARMAEASTGELLWTTSFTAVADDADSRHEQNQLAGGIGYGLALRINKLLNTVAESAEPGGRPAENSNDKTEYVIEQATAFNNRTSLERFQAAEAMLERALTIDPGNVDLQVAVASHWIRGIQSDWYPAAERPKKRASAESMLLVALRAKPTYLPALEGYCRFLTATNRFADSLVACAESLSFDPWSGAALYQTGLSQLQLGRFEEALQTFVLADQFGALQASRWTWLLGAGGTCIMLDRNEEAASWLERSIAISAGTGRSHLLLAVAYWKLGRRDEARLLLAKALQLRPNSTLQNFFLPSEGASPVLLDATARIGRVLAEIGLPQG